MKARDVMSHEAALVARDVQLQRVLEVLGSFPESVQDIVRECIHQGLPVEVNGPGSVFIVVPHGDEALLAVVALSWNWVQTTRYFGHSTIPYDCWMWSWSYNPSTRVVPGDTL